MIIGNISLDGPNSFVYPQGLAAQITDQQVLSIVNIPSNTLTYTLDRITRKLTLCAST
jgi:hypothetical protein